MFEGDLIFVTFVCYKYAIKENFTLPLLPFTHAQIITSLIIKKALFKYFSPADPLSSSNLVLITTIKKVNSKVLNNKERGQKRGEYLKLYEEGKAIVGK